jgi:hypothetical protein
MEATMTNRTIKHEVKLQKSVIVILGILAVGVCANAFAPAFSSKDAMAGVSGIQGVGICEHNAAPSRLPFCADIERTDEGNALLVKVIQ